MFCFLFFLFNFLIFCFLFLFFFVFYFLFFIFWIKFFFYFLFFIFCFFVFCFVLFIFLFSAFAGFLFIDCVCSERDPEDGAAAQQDRVVPVVHAAPDGLPVQHRVILLRQQRRHRTVRRTRLRRQFDLLEPAKLLLRQPLRQQSRLHPGQRSGPDVLWIRRFVRLKNFIELVDLIRWEHWLVDFIQWEHSFLSRWRRRGVRGTRDGRVVGLAHAFVAVLEGDAGQSPLQVRNPLDRPCPGYVNRISVLKINSSVIKHKLDWFIENIKGEVYEIFVLKKVNGSQGHSNQKKEHHSIDWLIDLLVQNFLFNFYSQKSKWELRTFESEKTTSFGRLIDWFTGPEFSVYLFVLEKVNGSQENSNQKKRHRLVDWLIDLLVLNFLFNFYSQKSKWELRKFESEKRTSFDRLIDWFTGPEFSVYLFVLEKSIGITEI